MTRGAANGLRRIEIASAIAGISLIGGVLAASAQRWGYQARQERAFSQSEAPLVSPVSIGANPVPRPTEETLDPLSIGRIEIPRLGVDAMVRQGADDTTLALAVGHVDGTSRPGEIGNTVLAGHRDTFFRSLGRIQLDDEVRVVVPGNTYDYRVVSFEVVAATETRVLEPTSDEVLTLVTCYPFRYIGSAPDRFVVRAARLGRPP